MTRLVNAAIAVDFKGWSKIVLGLFLLCLLPCTAGAGKLDRYQDYFDGVPALALEDLGHHRHSLQDYRGQVVLINFWASWCAPCLVEMPSLERLQQAMTGKPVAILAVNVGESRGKVWNFTARFKLSFSMLLDHEGQSAADWQVTFYPTTFLVDAQGDVQYVAFGARSWDSPEMIQAIEAMLETSQPVKAQTGPGPAVETTGNR